MNAILRTLRLLAVVVWVGGLVFFAFILAPTAFNVLPATHGAGTIVGATLRILNRLGDTSGFIFILATLALWLQASPRQRKLLQAQMLLVLLMLAATAYVQESVVPAMERDRIAVGGDIDAAPPNDPARVDFERLHSLSENVEGSALFLGFALIPLIAMEDTGR